MKKIKNLRKYKTISMKDCTSTGDGDVNTFIVKCNKALFVK